MDRYEPQDPLSLPGVKAQVVRRRRTKTRQLERAMTSESLSRGEGIDSRSAWAKAYKIPAEYPR